jgi:hypothetical protein
MPALHFFEHDTRGLGVDWRIASGSSLFLSKLRITAAATVGTLLQ